jgi:hypothetical protein
MQPGAGTQAREVFLRPLFGRQGAGRGRRSYRSRTVWTVDFVNRRMHAANGPSAPYR